MNKVQQLIAYIEELENKSYHLIGENYVTLKNIKSKVLQLFKEEYEEKSERT